MTDELRAFLVARRKRLCRSQADVAEAMGITQAAVSRLESGVSADPGLTAVARWGAALDVEICIEVLERTRARFPLLVRPEDDQSAVDVAS